jgi:hypothetical protein
LLPALDSPLYRGFELIDFAISRLSLVTLKPKMTIVKLSVQQGVYHTLTNNSTNEAPFRLPPIGLLTCAIESQIFKLDFKGVDLKAVKFFFMGDSKPVDDSAGEEMEPEDSPEKMLGEGAAAVEAVYIRAVIPSATSSSGGESPQLFPA